LGIKLSYAPAWVGCLGPTRWRCGFKVYASKNHDDGKPLTLKKRFTVSFNERKTAPLSKAAIERYTKLQGKTILESLASLEKKKLIVKISDNTLSFYLSPMSKFGLVSLCKEGWSLNRRQSAWNPG
jgi:hypothetical protein